MEDLEQRLTERVKGASKIVVVGIGEDKLRDDGVGPFIITQLKKNNKEFVKIINGRTTPDERMSDIIDFNPSHVILIDTCTLNKPSGTIAILEDENILNYISISSHTLPIPVFISILEEKIKGVCVFLIGIVPKVIDLSDPLVPYKEEEITLDDYDDNPDLPYFEFQLSKEVKNAANIVIETLNKVLSTCFSR